MYRLLRSLIAFAALTLPVQAQQATIDRWTLESETQYDDVFCPEVRIEDYVTLNFTDRYDGDGNLASRRLQVEQLRVGTNLETGESVDASGRTSSVGNSGDFAGVFINLEGLHRAGQLDVPDTSFIGSFVTDRGMMTAYEECNGIGPLFEFAVCYALGVAPVLGDPECAVLL